MAVRVRRNERIFCAAMYKEKQGDIYIDDSKHEILSLNLKVLVTEPHEQHILNGEWWWVGKIPDGITIDAFYKGDDHE